MRQRDEALFGSAFGVTAEQDSVYMELAKDPEANREVLLLMVDEAARLAGLEIHAYHGSPRKGFTSFKLGKDKAHDWSLSTGAAVHFAERLGMAEDYADGGDVRHFYIPSNLLEVKSEIEYAWFQHPDGTTTHKVKRFTMYDMVRGIYPDIEIITPETKTYAQSLGYEGLKYNWKALDHEYAIFDPNRIKISDSVTYDENGNVIPLSQRFNRQSDSILYSQFGNAQDAEYLTLAQDPEANRERLQALVRVRASAEAAAARMRMGFMTAGMVMGMGWWWESGYGLFV
jgi:hypothetical protein